MYLASTSYLMVCQLSLWSFYSCTYKCLTLEMSFRRNLTPQRRSPIKLLLLFAFQALLSSLGFVYPRIFLSVSKKILYICKNVNLENSFKSRDLPFPLGLAQVPAKLMLPPHAHIGCGWQDQGCNGPDLELAAPTWPIVGGWFVTTSRHGAGELWVGPEVIRYLWQIWGLEVCMTLQKWGRKTEAASLLFLDR